MNQEEIKRNLLDADQWIRIIFMVGFAIVAWFVLVGLLVLVVVQTLISLISGEPNRNLQKAGFTFGCWLHEMILFLVYNTDEKPFPFAEFPTADDATGKATAAGANNSASRAAGSTSGTDTSAPVSAPNLDANDQDPLA
jgi:hypothetical protein